MKLWLVNSSEDYGDIYIRSIWDSEEKAINEANRLTKEHEKEIDEDTPEDEEPNYYLTFWVSSQPYFLNDNGR